jgi:predicted outer membrane repeat protein
MTGKCVRVTEHFARSLFSRFSFTLLGFALFVALAGAAPAQAAATTWYVSPTGDDTNNNGQSAAAPFKTIAKAISAAVGGTATTSGDTVLLADGTYPEHDLDYAGKAITVRSASDDPTKCVLDCQQKGRGFTFHSDESSTAVLQGITIKNGSASFGGAVYCNGSTPTIARCILLGNTATKGGGGMNNDGCSPTILGCVFAGNKADSGGAMSNFQAYPVFLGCVFAGNYAWNGGAIYSNEADLTLLNCTFAGNKAAIGGGMYNSISAPTVTNCTFTGNTATNGGGMYNDTSHPTLTNCILWGDTAPEIINDAYSAPTITYSDVQGLTNTTPDATTHNFGADPKFVRNPSLGTDGTWGTSDDDYGDLHLQAGSPCINAGNDAVVTAPPFPMDSTGTFLIDLDGKTRLVGMHVDLGAYEYIPPLPTYTWSGFLAPLFKQSFKQGSTIPVKFQLTGDCAAITNLSASLYVTAPGATTETLLGTFSYDPLSGQYQCNWKTKGWPAGTYTLRADLGDGVTNRTIQVLLK